MKAGSFLVFFLSYFLISLILISSKTLSIRFAICHPSSRPAIAIPVSRSTTYTIRSSTTKQTSLQISSAPGILKTDRSQKNITQIKVLAQQKNHEKTLMLCEDKRILLFTNITTTRQTNYPPTPIDPRSWPDGLDTSIAKKLTIKNKTPQHTAVMTQEVNIALPNSSSILLYNIKGSYF